MTRDRIFAIPAVIRREALAGRVINAESMCVVCGIRSVSRVTKTRTCLLCDKDKRRNS